MLSTKASQHFYSFTNQMTKHLNLNDCAHCYRNTKYSTAYTIWPVKPLLTTNTSSWAMLLPCKKSVSSG